MNTKDELILKQAKKIREAADAYISYVEKLNPCAYSDRMIENIITLSEELAEMHNL